MSNLPALKVFEDIEFGEIRTVEIEGEPWFVAADICAVLDIANSRMATDRLDEDEKGVSSIDTLGGFQDMTIVSESGLYGLILGSRKPIARTFQRWITHEVIPAIRKEGYYMTPEKVLEVLGEGKILIMANNIKKERDYQNLVQAIEVSWDMQNMYPRCISDYYENREGKGAYLNFKQTAKMLGVPYRTLRDFLLCEGLVYPNRVKELMPCEGYDRSHFVIIEHYDRDYNAHKSQTVTTPLGREWLRSQIDRR